MACTAIVTYTIDYIATLYGCETAVCTNAILQLAMSQCSFCASKNSFVYLSNHC